MTTNRNKIAKEFGRNMAGTLIGLSAVPDNWMSQVKTYYKVDLKESSGLIMLLTAAMLMELISSRVEDMLSKGELGAMEAEMFDWVVDMVNMMANKRSEEENKERVDFLKKTLTKIIRDAQEARNKNDLTVPQVYSAMYFTPDYFGIKLPKEVFDNYLTSKVELFEGQNFWNELHNNLRSDV